MFLSKTLAVAHTLNVSRTEACCSSLLAEVNPSFSVSVMLASGKDLGDLVLVARAEGMKLFKGNCVKVVDVGRRSQDEWLVVVESSEGVSESRRM